MINSMFKSNKRMTPFAIHDRWSQWLSGWSAYVFKLAFVT